MEHEPLGLAVLPSPFKDPRFGSLQGAHSGEVTCLNSFLLFVKSAILSTCMSQWPGHFELRIRLILLGPGKACMVAGFRLNFGSGLSFLSPKNPKPPTLLGFQICAYALEF